MNIDVRNIKGNVLKNMNRLIETYGFTSTAKATRFVISEWFNKEESISSLTVELEEARREIRMLNQKLEDHEQLGELLRKTIGK